MPYHARAGALDAYDAAPFPAARACRMSEPSPRRPACSTAPSAASPPSGATWRPASPATRTRASRRRCAPAWTARGGEVSARNRAAKLAQTYLGLDDAGRTRLPAHAGRLRFRPGRRRRAPTTRCRRPPTPAERAERQGALRRALEPPRLRLLTQFTTIPDGMKFLVDLRAFLLTRAQGRPAAGGAGGRPARRCWRAGSTSASWNCSGSTGTARPRCWRSWSATRRCTRSAPGAT